MREPYIMRWPGRIPAGTTCPHIAGNIDLLPTFARLVLFIFTLSCSIDPARAAPAPGSADERWPGCGGAMKSLL